MTLPINVELVKGSVTGAVDVDLLKGAYVKSLTIDTAGKTMTLVCQDDAGNEQTVEVNAEVSAVTTGPRVAVGWSADATADASELTAESLTDAVIVPANTLNQYLVIWIANAAGTLSEIHYGGNPQNALQNYSVPVALEYNGAAGMVYVSSGLLVGRIIGGSTLNVVIS